MPPEIIEISSDSEADSTATSENSVECAAGSRDGFECRECGETFRFRAMRDRHMWTHRSARCDAYGQLLQCDYCDKAVASQLMDRHVRQIHNHESFYCGKCQKFWITSFTYMQHLRLRHGEEFVKARKHYECEQCGDTFDSHSGLIGHRKSHMKRVTYFCDFCMRKFHVKPHLRAHVQIHSRSKPFNCHLCKATFRREDYLKKHLRRHRVEKLTCKYCNRVFVRKQAYEEHKHRHMHASDSDESLVAC